MADLNIAVSFKSEAAAQWIESYLAEQRGEAPLDFVLKRNLLIELSSHVLEGWESYLWAELDRMRNNPNIGENYKLDEEELDPLELVFRSIEMDLDRDYPDYYALVIIPMDLNGMILAVLANHPETAVPL